MPVLLDTHTLLWFIEGNPRLSEMARRIVEDITNDRYVSIASIWETAIKVGKGRLMLHQPFDVLIPDQITRNAFQPLGVTFTHTAHVARLPHHHGDPFDRMLVAQAVVEQLPIISADPVFDAFPKPASGEATLPSDSFSNRTTEPYPDRHDQAIMAVRVA